ncbi:DUF998 domain-containing protein [Streptomyces sp. NPDC001002]
MPRPDGSRSIARTIGAVALIVAAIQYVIAEAVAASDWKDPHYSYSYNFISDLGVSSCGGRVQGRTICSPLHTVMNAGFIVQGGLVILAALLLFRLLPGRLRWICLALAVVHGVGITLVGLVHGSAESIEDGSMAWHGLGAAMAILGGNVLWIVVGFHTLRTLGQRQLGISGIALGTLGLVCVLLLMTFMPDNTTPDGVAVFERGSVYTIMAAELIAGVALLRSRATTPQPRNTPHPVESRPLS